MTMRPPPPRHIVKALSSLPFACLNCDIELTEATLFCSELCKDEAKFVRYFRACLRDGRYERPDVQEALEIRLGAILGGGYPERERRLPSDIREAVIERDGGKCRMCGQPGSQIDHIRDGSPDLSNIQLLCAGCHNKKTIAGFVEVSEITDPVACAKGKSLLTRVHARDATRVCDGPDRESVWRGVLKARKEAIYA